MEENSPVNWDERRGEETGSEKVMVKALRCKDEIKILKEGRRESWRSGIQRDFFQG